jgi:hypothetical protein
MIKIRRCCAGAVVIACMAGAPAYAQTAAKVCAADVCGAAPVVPLQSEPPAKLTVYQPLPDPLTIGRVVVQYRTENLHEVPVFGPTALDISPRIGHVHVSVDDNPWVWMSASGEPVTLNGLPPGPHKVTIHLETANHQQVDEGVVTFTVPAVPMMASALPPQPATNEPPAKIVIDPPRAEPLSRGVVFITYHTGNLQVAPVFGTGALAVVPRVGHIHVTVDDAAWHWEDASGDPVIVNGLSPGPHKILIQLVNANHQPIDQGTVLVTVPNV